MMSELLPSAAPPEPEVSEHVRLYLENKMRSFECSAHDVAHCFRVARNALRIVANEMNRPPGSSSATRATQATASADDEAERLPRIVFLAGLFHDVLDSKLQPVDGIDSAIAELRALLYTETQSLRSEEEFQRFLFVIQSVGYKHTLREEWDPYSMPLEYRCVQDADLLDAIGAIGVARTFAFTGKRNGALFGINVVSAASSVGEGLSVSGTEDAAAAYKKRSLAGAQAQQGNACVDHFFEKLLRIRSKMSTALGQQLAVDRHQAMISFLRQLHVELQDGGEDSCSDMLRILRAFEYAAADSSDAAAALPAH